MTKPPNLRAAVKQSQAKLSGIPNSERGGATKRSYGAGQHPQRTLNSSMTQTQQTSGRNSSPMTVSDAARLAAQQSKRGKVTMPLGQDGTLNSEQQAVLARLARGLGPKPSGPQMAGPAPAAQQAYPNTSRQAAPKASYAPSVQSDKSGRAPNRRRR